MADLSKLSWLPVVLMIDDAESDRDLAVPALRRVFHDVDVRLADACDQAFQYISEAQPRTGSEAVCPYPDLVLVDINRPETRGLDFIREFHQRRIDSQLPIVVLSSCSRQHEITEAYRYGARACIQKPLEPRHLITSLTLVNRYFFARHRPARPIARSA